MEHDPVGLSEDLPSAFQPVLHELEGRVASAGKRDVLPELIWRGRATLIFRPPTLGGFVAKRLPPFSSEERRGLYMRSVDAYARLLHSPVGLDVVPHHCAAVRGDGKAMLYILQPECPAESIGDRLIQDLSVEAIPPVLATVLREALRVWHRNEIERELHAFDSQIGLDLRLSNWSITSDDRGVSAAFFDTGTPFIRRLGRDRVDPEIFPNHIPAPPSSFWSRRNPAEELDRYYDFRLALIDLLGEIEAAAPQHSDAALAQVNAFLNDEAEDLGESSIDSEEVKKAAKIEKKRRKHGAHG